MPSHEEIQALQEEWDAEFRDLDFHDDWELIEDNIIDQLRWVNIKRKVVRHRDGDAIAIEYAVNVGDGESASAYEDKWYPVEEVEKTVKAWVRRE